jgi:hypothetical protein
MLMSMIEKVVGPLFGSLSGYFNLPAYLKEKWTEHKHGLKSYFSEEEYWKDAIGIDFHMPSKQTLKEGDIVELQAFELSEWFPRAPGAFWTRHGSEFRAQAQQEIESQQSEMLIFTPRGKQYMMQGGMGTQRLNSQGIDKAKYKILGATSSGKCSRGIPLILAENVYDHIRSDLLTEGALRATLKGVYTPLPIPQDEILLKAAGVSMPVELQDWVSRSFFVPRFCLLVESSINIQRMQTTGTMRADAWSVYRDDGGDYGWTYCQFDPANEGSLQRAVSFLHEYAHSHSNSGRVSFVTEFDETTPRLNAEWNIKDVLRRTVDPRPIAQSLLSWGEKIE